MDRAAFTILLHNSNSACLPLRSESVATLRRFVDTRSAAGWGAVAHAFAAGLRQLLSEWSLFTAQLEHRALCGALPLQVMSRQRRWFIVKQQWWACSSLQVPSATAPVTLHAP